VERQAGVEQIGDETYPFEHEKPLTPARRAIVAE
jgi:hypothetical protein